MGFVGCFVCEALNKHVGLYIYRQILGGLDKPEACEASSCLSDVSPSGWARASSPIARPPIATR